MHILLVNDDGPPSNQSSPYIHSLVSVLQSFGHTVSVVLPHVQRSWIGKAHIVGHTLTPIYFRPGTLHNDDGITSSRSFNDGKEEWLLFDGTPASCVQIGLYHVFKDRGPVDLVLSGPNYGRNTTAVFSLSSGTIGGALEGAVCGMKSIALSYAFDSREHCPETIAAASRLSTRLIEKFVKEWPEDVHLYSINVPLRRGVEDAKIIYTEMLQNQWSSGSSFKEIPAEESGETDPGEQEQEIRQGQNEVNGGDNQQLPKPTLVKYKWSPNFADVRESVKKAGQGDGWAVVEGMVSVTPLRANFWHLPAYKGEIKLSHDSSKPSSVTSLPVRRCPAFYALIDYHDSYVQPFVLQALSAQLPNLPYELISSINQLPSPDAPFLQCTAYEALDFGHAIRFSSNTLICAYVIRKALIRKHYLNNTVSSWVIKRCESLLRKHFKAGVHFEVDFAEFLDEALVDAWDLNESLARNEKADKDKKEWWILKPGMTDGGNGIRLFSNMEELTCIFEEWEEEETVTEEAEDDGAAALPNLDDAQREVQDGDNSNGAMTSQLRHFIAQPYIHSPLLLQSMGNRKFHIRVYVLAVGALKVYVYREMLALFAAKPYRSPHASKDEPIDLASHLTNTCFQDKSTRERSVSRFWTVDERVDGDTEWKTRVFEQICEVTGEVFEAAAREQMVHFQAIPNAFEVFGVDFLVDADVNVWLLELNAYPDFKQTGQGLQDMVVGGLFEEVVTVAIAPFFNLGTSGRNGTERMQLVRDIDLGRR